MTTTTTTESAHVKNWTWSPETGRTEPVGIADGRAMHAAEHEDGTWTWNGFIFHTLDGVRIAARRNGY